MVYLIGTLHFSQVSVDDVRMLIEAVQPDVMAIEVRRNERKLRPATVVPVEADFRTFQACEEVWSSGTNISQPIEL